MLLPDAREAIVTTCRELSRAGLVVGTAGNVSVREGDLVAVTPSGVRYAELTPELVGVHRLDGAAVEAPLAPTSELPLHLAIYAARPEVRRGRAHALAGRDRTVRTGGRGAGGALLRGDVRRPGAVAPYATYGTDRASAQRGARAARSHRLPHGQPRRGHRRPGPGDRA